MTNLKSKIGMLSILLALASCSNDDTVESPDPDPTPTTATVALDFTGLEDLGSDYLYEGWVIVDGAPVSTGTFSVDANGGLSRNQFEMDAQMLADATTFVLSIEPNPDPSPTPADTKIFVGDFNGNTASLGTGTVAPSFESLIGKFIIAAPTGTGAENEKYSGVWFLDNSSGSPVAGLELPVLEAGWKYEGWIVVDGVPLTTGTFTSASGSDEVAPFSGANPGPMYPGEDFLQNAPDGVEFPTDVRGKTAVISVEPFPDNSPAPFTLKPLAGMIAVDAMGVQEIESNVVASFPNGTVTR